uniref:tRNA (Guanine-N(7)-)-methyltransferase n=1 Tax=Lygus hesperus TaxID=30085 RepID=A0A0A9YXE8_LYGHE
MSLRYLRNVFIIHGDAKLALRHCFLPNTVECVFINYPEPPTFLTQQNTFVDGALLRTVHTLLVEQQDPHVRTVFGVRKHWSAEATNPHENKDKIVKEKRKKKGVKFSKNDFESTTGSVVLVTDDQVQAGSAVR